MSLSTVSWHYTLLLVLIKPLWAVKPGTIFARTILERPRKEEIGFEPSTYPSSNDFERHYAIFGVLNLRISRKQFMTELLCLGIKIVNVSSLSGTGPLQ